MASLFCVFSVDHQRLPFLWQGLFPEWEFGAVYVFVLLQSICRCFVYSHSWLTWRFLSFISYPFRILLCWPLFFACKCRFFYCPGPISMYSFTDVFFFFFPSEFYLFVCFPNVFGLFTNRRFWAGLLEMVFFGHENIQLERLGSFSLPILNWGEKMSVLISQEFCLKHPGRRLESAMTLQCTHHWKMQGSKCPVIYGDLFEIHPPSICTLLYSSK